MTRAIIWIVAFSPLLAAMLLPIPPQQKGWILVYVRGPFLLGAIVIEAVYLRVKKRPVTGSSGNFLAAVLGVALLVTIGLWLLLQLR